MFYLFRADRVNPVGYLRRQVITTALLANAYRPVKRPRSGIASFAAGWLTTEMAPHLAAVTGVDTAAQAVRGRRPWLGYALAGLNAYLLRGLVQESAGTRLLVEEALVTAAGEDFRDSLEAAPTQADLATPWRDLVIPFRMSERREGVDYRVERNLSYSPAGKRGLLDVYRPVTDVTDAPVLFHVHGGAWTIGNKEEQALPLLQRMASMGWVCVSINYRLAPRNPFPAQIIDTKHALAWTKQHISEYGGDPGYIAITGGSAGGHLTALAALTPNDPQFQPGFEDADTTVQLAVPHYGVYDLAGESGVATVRDMRDGFFAPRVFHKRYADEPAAFAQASPYHHINAEAPDFFVLHGTNDTLVDVAQARTFVEKLQAESQQQVTYVELPGAQHAFDIFPSIRSAHVVRALAQYLEWHWRTTHVSVGASDAPAG